MTESLSVGDIEPDLSMVIPCYNEEDVVAYTVRRITETFDRAGYRLELVTVDNGSSDGTGSILQSLADARESIVVHRVEVNEGYGHGVISGMSRCTAPWVGYIPADGQVDPEDLVRLYEIAMLSRQDVVAKVRRRFRMDGPFRKLGSLGFNIFVRVLWPSLVWDINATPKILPRHLFAAMRLKSKGWALDAELMTKASYMGVRTVELNVLSRERCSGTSKIRPGAMQELIGALFAFRFSRELRQLRSEWKSRPAEGDQMAPRAGAPPHYRHA